MRNGKCLLYPSRKLDTVHDRHHQITDNEIYRIAAENMQSLFSVRGFQYMILFAEDGTYIAPHIRIILHNQNRQSLFLFGSVGRLYRNRFRIVMIDNDCLAIRFAFLLQGEKNAERTTGMTVIESLYLSAVHLYDPFAEIKSDTCTCLTVDRIFYLVL